jgi:hypothetical protein
LTRITSLQVTPGTVKMTVLEHEGAARAGAATIREVRVIAKQPAVRAILAVRCWLIV